MKDYLAEARQYIREKHGDKVSVLEESIVDLDRFYCFTFQFSEFIQTRDSSIMLAGQGYTIINKEDNRFFNFGSRYSLDESLKVLEENLKIEKRIRKDKPQFDLRERYDLYINCVKKRQLLIDFLKDSGVTFIIPEVVGDSIFRIPKAYNSKNIEKRLKEDYPVVFHGIHKSLELFDKLLMSDCCDFQLFKHQEKSLAKYIDKATDEDLKSIW